MCKILFYCFLIEYRSVLLLLCNPMTLLEDDLINLEQFEVQDKIEKSFSYKFYQIMNINNGRKSTAKVSSYNINPFCRENLIIFSREVSIMSRINFPSITKLNGYNLKNFKNKSKPTIIMDFSLKHTLCKLLSDDELELNDTQKLINLYGIASAISYLHSHNIIHGNLNTISVYLDENLYPKLNGFENYIEIPQNSSSDFYKSPVYPTRSGCSKYNDIYDFAIIASEIMNGEHFPNFLDENFRPSIKESVAECYKNLIQKCCSQNIEDRPK